MTRRQPEIGSALGRTTDETIGRIDARLALLRATRERLISELVTAHEALAEGQSPLDVAQRLREAV